MSLGDKKCQKAKRESSLPSAFDGGVKPKKAWAAGTLTVRASDIHGIRSVKSVMFNNLEEFMIKLDEVLRNNAVTLYVEDSKGKLTPRLGKEYPKWAWSG